MGYNDIEQQPVIVYLMGAGRSGTTILDAILGNADDSLSLGEINRFFKRHGIPPKRDNASRTYMFWEKVKADFEKKYEARGDYDLYNSIIDENEYHKSLFKVVTNKTDSRYFKLQAALYASIAENTDQKILIESSKYPIRAYNLTKIFEKVNIGVKFIYLKKDPVNVVNSFAKKGIEQPAKGLVMANIYYFVVNSICEFIRLVLIKKGFEVVSLKYEEFLKDPVATIGRIESEIHVDLDVVKGKLRENEAFETGIMFDGNRIRLENDIKLKKFKANKQKNFKYYFTRIFNYLIYR